MNIAIYGLGQFGFAIARHFGEKYSLDNKIKIKAFEIRDKVRNYIAKKRQHPFHFLQTKLPRKIRIVESLKELLEDCDLIILAIPAQRIRNNIKIIKDLIKKNIILLNVAKALEKETDLPLSTVLKQELKDIKFNYKIAALGGGMIASDMIKGNPVAADIACQNIETAKKLCRIFNNEKLRAYPTRDVIGVEYAGAIKNVIAIGAGISDGLGYGISTKMHIITKGAKETITLIQHLKARQSTFNSFSQCWGNDLILSCVGRTRNRFLGELIGKGLTIKQALKKLESEHKIAEGYATAKLLNDIAKKKMIKLPIIKQIYQVLYENKKPKDFIKAVWLE